MAYADPSIPAGSRQCAIMAYHVCSRRQARWDRRQSRQVDDVADIFGEAHHLTPEWICAVLFSRWRYRRT